MPESVCSAILKRTIDIFGALFGLILCAPFMLLIALFIWVKAGSPLLYRETRIGLHQKAFRLCKFRSMKTLKGNFDASVASGDDPRMLSFGHFLRKTHLDELPQLWSVLTGAMSLVGPRPYKPSHFERLPEASRDIIASVKPGLTGSDALAFFSEDAALTGLENPEAVYLAFFLPEKAKLQIQAIQTQSIRTDLWLIFQTLWAIFCGDTRAHSLHHLRSLLADKGDYRS